MNKTLGWIIGLLLIIGIGYYIYSVSYSSPAVSTTNEPQTEQKGMVAVSFSDATTVIKNVNEVTLAVDKVELYNSTKGWVTVSSDSKTYKLLELNKKGEKQIYATAEVPADTYSRARVTLGDVTVHTSNKGDKTATVPSHTIDTSLSIVVNPDQTSSLNLDVLADKSVHTTAKGEYVFTPVVSIDGRSNATVTTADTGVVTQTGGTVDTNATVGMDVDGSVKNDFQINSNAKLDVDASGTVVNLSGGAANLNINSSGSTNTNTTNKPTNDDSSGSGVNLNNTLNGTLHY
jgi:hypothetical protein